MLQTKLYSMKAPNRHITYKKKCITVVDLVKDISTGFININILTQLTVLHFCLFVTEYVTSFFFFYS